MTDENQLLKLIEDVSSRVSILENAFNVEVKTETQTESDSSLSLEDRPSKNMDIDIHKDELKIVLSKIGFSQNEVNQRFDLDEVLKSFIDRRKTALDYRVKKHIDSLSEREKQVLNSFFDLRLPFEPAIKIGGKNERKFEI